MVVRNSWVTQGKEEAGFIDKVAFEQIQRQGDMAIHKWIDEQLKGTSVTVVLIGTVTVIFISPRMKENEVKERDQWIPWEVSYSLKEVSRRNKNGDPITSKTNAMVAVVLPDSQGLYSYYLEKLSCCSQNCICHHLDRLFSIIRENKFNLKNPTKSRCEKGSTVWRGDPSYIKAVTWESFIADYNFHITCACERQDNIDDYAIHKEI